MRIPPLHITISRLGGRSKGEVALASLETVFCRGTFMGAPWGPFHDVRNIWDEYFGHRPYKAHSMGIASRLLTSQFWELNHVRTHLCDVFTMSSSCCDLQVMLTDKCCR